MQTYQGKTKCKRKPVNEIKMFGENLNTFADMQTTKRYSFNIYTGDRGKFKCERNPLLKINDEEVEIYVTS